MRYLKKFETLGEYEMFRASAEFVKPNVSLIGTEVKFTGFDPPLYVEAIEDLTVSFSTNAIQYSLDKANWVDLPAATATPTISAGQKVYFKASGLTARSSAGIGTFSMTAPCNVGGNIMSMSHGDDYVNATEITQSYQFYSLFKNAANIVSAENLVLPATTLTSYSYGALFYQCTSLTKSFSVLPATIVPTWAYSTIFRNCSNLQDAPEILATSIGTYGCKLMFSGCKKLVKAPSALYAKSPNTSSYESMFSECYILEVAPVIYAETLANYCCSDMFRNCRKLSYIKAMFITEPSSSYTSNWVDGVATSGTFVKNAAATWENSFGNSAIPSGWTVETADA
jgi:hypothetical protein